jgi:hypothetical protein
MSAAVSVRSMLARSPTLISSKVRLRMTSRSEEEKVSVMVVSLKVLGEDVEAAVDVVDVARDGARRVAHEERAERAPRRRSPLRAAAARGGGRPRAGRRSPAMPEAARVRIGPGDTALTRMPRGPSSVAR